MRVAIDLMIAEKEPGGMLFAIRALIDGLAQTDEGFEYVIITTRPQAYQTLATVPHIRLYPVKLRSWHGLTLQHQLLMPGILRYIQPDVLHVPTFVAPLLWHGPLVITVHDLAFLKMPQQASLYAHLYWHYALRTSVQRARHIIAVSAQTRLELLSTWSIASEKISVIHNALRPSLCCGLTTPAEVQQIRQYYGNRYLLHVGRIMPRKNIEILIEAFNALATHFPDLQLVLTGGVGYGSAPVLQQIIQSHYHERIHLLGWVAEQELTTLYTAASVLVFPSHHEGFGLPTIEAMACGTPVIASFEAASQEIAGNAVLRTDCTSVPALVHTITQVLTNDVLREQLIQQGKEQTRLFSSKLCAQATNRVYRDALSVVGTD